MSRLSDCPRQIDCEGPEGNVFMIAALARSWNRQLDRDMPDLLTATTDRLGGEVGDYTDALDTFDEWFDSFIDYEFVNDPRNERV